MRFYKLKSESQELYYSNLMLLCKAHKLSYRSANDKIKRQKLPYKKNGMVVRELHMIGRD